jgi:hypothetical protein
MIGQLSAVIVNEGNWLPASMSLAFLATAILLYRNRDLPVQVRVLAAMHLLFGATIGTMALGHLLAVTTKLALGTLEGSLPVLYGIGIVLALPAGWIIHHTRTLLRAGQQRSQRTLLLNAWLAITLLLLGLPNLPLTIPGILNIAYDRHASRTVGWAIVGLVAVFNVALLIGALIFMASGQSFEQFSGME